MELVPDRAHVELRPDRDGGHTVVLSFPYDRALVELCRSIPHRRFDWDRASGRRRPRDWAAMKVIEALERFPELTPSPEVARLARPPSRGAGSDRSAPCAMTGAAGWCSRRSPGPCPSRCCGTRVEHDGRLLVPLTRRPRRRCAPSARRAWTSAPSAACRSWSAASDPPPARLVCVRGVDGEELRLEVLWDPDIGLGVRRAAGRRGHPLGAAGPVARRDAGRVHRPPRREVTGEAVDVLERLLAEHRSAADAVRRSRATEAEPIAETAAVLGGEPAPFQWAAVRYALEARGTFLADEQGLGKTVEALAALEADGAYPAVVVCPASMKLGWERETQRWLPHRSVTVVHGRGSGPARRPRSRSSTTRSSPPTTGRSRAGARAALVVDESHYCKNPQAKRTQAVRRLAAAVAPGGLRLALSGTPVLNHAEELIAQLRIIGRMEDFGSGAQLRRPVPRHGLRGAAALAHAPRLLRAPAQVRGAPAAAGQAPGGRPGGAHQRGRVPAGRARRHRVAALPAAGPVRAQRQDRRHAARRSAWRSSAPCSAWPPAASWRRRWRGSRTSSPPGSRWWCSPATSRSSRR